MKTLIISGSYRAWWKQNDIRTSTLVVDYNITIFGQHDSNPVCIYITNFDLLESFHEKMIQECKDRYCKYFNTDEVNLIFMENIICINTTPPILDLHVPEVDIRESYTNC